MFLRPSKEGIVIEVQVVLMVSKVFLLVILMMLLVMLLLLLLLLKLMELVRGLDENWNFDFLNDWEGMRNFLLYNFLNRIRNFDFLYLHYRIRPGGWEM